MLKSCWEKSEKLAKEAGAPLILQKVLEKDTAKYGSLGIDRNRFTDKFTELIDDDEIKIIIELIGGEHPAYEFIKEALKAGKHVVTANKEVLAKHGYRAFSSGERT